MKKLKKFIPAGAWALPLFAFAADFFDIMSTISSILNTLVPLLIAVAVVVFLWGVIQYVTAGGDEEKRTKGRNTMIYGIIGLFVMVAVWGLVNVLLSTFGLDTGAPDTPVLPY